MIEFRNNSKVNRTFALASVFVLAAVLLVSAGSFLSSVGMYAPMAQVVQFASAQGEEHGLGLTKVCSKVVIGSNNTCTFTATNLDEFSDRITINNALDTMLAPYPGAPVTHTKNGGAQIAIIAIVDLGTPGDTTCTVGGSLPCVIGPGDRVRFQDTSFVMSVAGSIPDTASVSWTDLCDSPTTTSCDPVTSQSATAGATTTVINPDLTVVKSLSPSKVNSGGQINVTAHVTNTGSVTLTGLTASDTEAGTLTCNTTTLTAGASTDCTGSFNPTQSGTNTVTATANHQLGQVSDTDSEDFTVIDASIEVVKSLSPSKVASGGQINVTAHVTNTGNVELTGLNATDTEAGTLTCDDTTLAAGASTDCTGSFNPTSDGTNTVTVEANYQLGQVSDTDSEDFTVINPSITVEKECTPSTQTEPGTITWTITTTNTGNVALDVVVSDTSFGTTFDGTLAAGASNVTTIIQSGLPAGTYSNNVTATGEHQLGSVEDKASASCEVQPGGNEGLTPGFWKANAENWGAVAWGPTGESPNDKFNSVFGTHITIRIGKVTYNDPTLLQALSATGGINEAKGVYDALARHCVAAKLNAEHPLIDYPMSAADVISQCAAAMNNNNFTDAGPLKDQLDAFNNLGGGIDQHGNPI